MKRFLCILLVCILTAGLSVSRLFRNASAQQEQPEAKISESALRQIQSLIEEKESRTAEQKKINSQLLYATKQNRRQAITSEVQTLELNVKPDDKGRVLVDIKADVTNELIGLIEKVGGEIVHSSPGYHRIRAHIPLDGIERLASSNDVRSIDPAVGYKTHRIQPRPILSPGSLGPLWQPGPGADYSGRAARVRSLINAYLPTSAVTRGMINPAGLVPATGAFVSQGDIAHRAKDGRAIFGVNGEGVKIGVLSDSVKHLEESQASGELPPDVTVVPGESGLPDPPGSPTFGEGTAMLEIIHDLAPGAKLFFATASKSPASFAENIRRLRFEQGCDIIVDDVLYFDESPFQDGIIAQAVNDVTADGALYFSSAGNNGNINDGTSSTWEGDFVDGGSLFTLPSGREYKVCDFGDGNISNRMRALGQPSVLYWSDPLGGSSNDYDLFLLNPNLSSVVSASTGIQDGDDDPMEITGTPPGGTRLVIARAGNAQVRALHLATFGGQLAISTSGATYGHSAAADACSVAAVNVAVAGTGPFTGGPTNPVEIFSSDGPRRIFYKSDGTPITPGNILFNTGGGELRLKPDIAAADGVATSILGFLPFLGTSAAAPHAAAIAGLVKSASPSLTPAEIRTRLFSTALDIEASGRDRDSGYGILSARAALLASGARPGPLLSVGRVEASPALGDGDNIIEPGEAATLKVELNNIGDGDAKDVTMQLASSTPGVSVFSSRSGYPNIPPGGAGMNRLPFIFVVDRNAPCGLNIDFTMTLRYRFKTSPQVLTFTLPTAPELLVNGGFETGDFRGWTKVLRPDSSGDFFVLNGMLLPRTGFTSAGPKSGEFYAVDDGTGPGTHAILQSFTVPAGSTKVLLSYDLFANNYFFGGTFIDPIGLDHRVPTSNQHGRVDILRADAGAFDTGTGVLRNFFLGADPGAANHPYTHYEFDIADLVGAGGTFQLRFAATNNRFFFNLGVDNVSIRIVSCDAVPCVTTSLKDEQRR